ncbi:ATP-binding protein [Pseudomonas sp. M30-35]|nr:ATP-binding protein [Pseudomonas sp. M30-35]
MNVVSVLDCSKSFGHGPNATLALSGVDMEVVDGELMVLLGPSGCGKSTLLRLVSGLETASSGSLTLLGEPLDGPHPEVGMIFQTYTSFPWLTIEDNVGFGLKLRGVPTQEWKQSATEMLEKVGLKEFKSSYPGQLSGGMQQRVAIARALTMSPKVLLMDEPFGALDALTRVEMQLFLLDICQREKMTIIFVTHDIDEAILLADRITILSPHPGRVFDTVSVEIPHPRRIEDTEEPAFVSLRHRLRSAIFSMKASA